MFGSYRGRHRSRGAPRRSRAPRILALVVVVGTLIGAVLLGGPFRGAWDRTGLAPSGGAARASPVSPVGPANPSAPPPVGSVTIVAVGDTMLGNTPTLPPSAGTYLSAVRGALRAGIVFANLEGTLTDGGSSKCPLAPTAAPSSSPSPSPPPRCFAFRVPPSYSAYLRRAGFTIVNNANNHSYDFGAPGLADTIHALNSTGIAHTGLPRQIAVERAWHLTVAFLGFAPYANTASLLDLPAARAVIAKSGTMADVVVVYMHAGAEGSDALHVTGSEETYAGEDRGNPKAFAHMAVRAGADLVIASGPHVLRGMEFYRGRLIAYSLGNFAGYRNFSTVGTLRESCILRVRLRGDGSFEWGRVVPLRLTGDGQPFPDPSGAATALMATLSRHDFGSAAARITDSGRILQPGVGPSPQS